MSALPTEDLTGVTNPAPRRGWLREAVEEHVMRSLGETMDELDRGRPPDDLVAALTAADAANQRLLQNGLYSTSP
ncbi:hypothetical protein E1281_33040 [Actinomadura sp. KC345]|nr:hypothetical protein E1281_33040 [Actinomadura sp. KC345]